jgi:hypothetical protein
MSEKCHFRTHAPQQATLFAIAPSARATNVGGNSRPSALAVLRLTTSTNLVSWTMGRSPVSRPRECDRHRHRPDTVFLQMERPQNEEPLKKKRPQLGVN